LTKDFPIIIVPAACAVLALLLAELGMGEDQENTEASHVSSLTAIFIIVIMRYW